MGLKHGRHRASGGRSTARLKLAASCLGGGERVSTISVAVHSQAGRAEVGGLSPKERAVGAKMARHRRRRRKPHLSV